MARVVSADEGEDLQINNILLHPQLWRDEDLGFSGRASSIHSPDNGLLQPYSNGSSHFSQQLPYSSMDAYAAVSNCCRSLDDFVPFVDIARISTLSEATTPKPPLQATNQPPTVSSGNTSTGSCKQQTSRERRKDNRKMQEKRIVCVPLSKGTGRPNREGRSSDIWAWRKYGQKPIKGSPYPRGYYKCSSCKGCSARKQVEISKNDPSMLIITYTFDHNHPMPTNHTHANPSQQPTSTQVHTATKEKLSKPGQEEATSSEAFQTPDCSIDSSTMLIDPLTIDAIMAKREASVDIKMMYNIPSANYLSTSQELEEIFADLEELPEPSTNFGRATIKGEPLDGEAIDGSVMTSLDSCNNYAMWSSSSSNLHRMVNT